MSGNVDTSETIPLRREMCEPVPGEEARAQEGLTEAAAESPSTRPDRVGRYEVRTLLGKGGFGCVYLAYDSQLQRRVAIKIPHPELVSSAGKAEDFFIEARALAGLDHPNIVPVYDIGSTEAYPCYVVYKYIEGRDLRAMMNEGPVPYHRAARIVADIADALHHSHKHGLVHRDIKPGNILIDDQGRPYLADFGLALRLEGPGERPMARGTPDYMSPEQAGGEIGKIDGRSDIFSLGVVFYQLLTHALPFRGTSLPEIIQKIIAAEVQPPRQRDDRIPKAMEQICLRALSRKRADRYTTALDMWEALQDVMTYHPKPIDVSGVVLPGHLNELVERLAKNSHDVWAVQRITEGWQVGDVRDDKQKTHPDLVPYEYMSDAEKEYDRQSIRTALESILALGYAISPGAPGA